MEPQKIENETENTVDLQIVRKQTGILSEEFLEPYKAKIPPFGPLGFVTYKRTYARRIDKENRTEEWWETCRREIEGICSLGCEFSKEEAEKFYDDIFNLKCSFSGRGKWQLGTKTVKKLGGASLNACWLVVIDHYMSFVFAFDMLMLGGGVGFNIQKEFVYQLPKIKRGATIVRQDTNDADYIVPDSRQGWCELLKKVLLAFFETGEGFSYSTVCIRGKGTPIKGFGGLASGPEDLCEGINDICKIIKERTGKKLRPIDCLDIMNIIGRVVVSGNVRRSALLALGDQDDFQYLSAKRWDLGDIPNWRAYSNNSLACSDINTLPEKFWESFIKDPKTGQARGENYGLVNLKLARERGRVHDTHRTDPEVVGTNPCGEITLGPPQETGQGEACNLIEIFLPKIASQEEFSRIAKLCYRVVKTVAAQNYHWPETNEIVHKNMRLGISVTGICDWFGKISKDEASIWLDKTYKELEEEDARYSEKLGFNKSIKLTTVKPSGTLSLLPQVSPGVHANHSQYYVRRIRFASDDPLIPELRERGFHIEPKIEFDGSYDHDTVVVSFPVKAPEGSICKKDFSAVDQLELVKFMNTHWSDNSTSVTVTYKEDEMPAIREWMKKNYNNYVKSVSFLMYSDHGFKQSPYEEITKEQYEEMSKKVKPIYSLNQADSGSDFDDNDSECAKGACPRR